MGKRLFCRYSGKEREDKLSDQMSMEEFIDPFTGEPVKGTRKRKKVKDPLRVSEQMTLRLSRRSVVE